MTDLVIRTGVGEELRVRPASVGARMMAFARDIVPWWGTTLVVIVMASGLGRAHPQSGGAIDAILGLALPWLLVIGPAMRQHREKVTGGQRWSGLRLMRSNGDPPRLADCLVREVLRPADLLPPLVLLAMMGSRRSAGERAAGLMLVHPQAPREG